MALRLETAKSPGWWLWAVAVCASAGLHVGLVQLNPNLLLGQSPIQAPVPAGPKNSVQLQARDVETVQRELPGLLDRLAVESSENLPGLSDPVMPAPGEWEGREPDPEHTEFDPEVRSADLPEESGVETPDSNWTPRQEVLAITDRRVTEPLEFLPRTFRSTESMVPDAPDLSLPDSGETFQGGGNDEWISAAPRETVVSGGNPMALPGLPELELPGLGGDGAIPGKGEGLPELGDLPGLEPNPDLIPEEVTGMEAVEDLLRLETRVWEDPAEPDVRYFKIQIRRNGIEALPVMPRELVVMIDCSASMTEEKLQMALRGVRSALDTLDEKDTFTLAAFRNDVQRMHPVSIPATVINRAKGRAFLSGLHAYGKTDVFASLESLYRSNAQPTRPVQALLITDGVPTQGVMDTRELLDRFTENNQGRVSVFSVGGGNRVNRFLLDFLSFRNRGRSLVKAQKEQLPIAIRDLAQEIDRPVLADISYRFTRASRLEIYPRRLTHLYLDSHLILVGRAPVDQPVLGFQMVGTSVKGPHDMVFEVDLREVPNGGPTLRREWAWQALLEQLAESSGGIDSEKLRSIHQWKDTYGLELPGAYLPNEPGE